MTNIIFKDIKGNLDDIRDSVEETTNNTPLLQQEL